MAGVGGGSAGFACMYTHVYTHIDIDIYIYIPISQVTLPSKLESLGIVSCDMCVIQVHTLPKGLDTEVAEHGGNFSAGQGIYIYIYI